MTPSLVPTRLQRLPALRAGEGVFLDRGEEQWAGLENQPPLFSLGRGELERDYTGWEGSLQVRLSSRVNVLQTIFFFWGRLAVGLAVVPLYMPFPAILIQRLHQKKTK